MTDRAIPRMSDNTNDEPTTGSAGEPGDAWRVHLPVFEGPIELLLYLITKNELDIHQIPLARITREYLAAVELIELVDLESAGDYLVTAARLLKIKARSMFEVGAAEAEDEGPTVSRDELLGYLKEFERLGGVADLLAAQEGKRQGVYPRGGERTRIEDRVQAVEPEPDFELFDLLAALREVLKNAPKVTTHDVELFSITPEMKQKEILALLAGGREVEFVAMVAGQPRLIIVVTFIALLELIRSRRVAIRQEEQFGRILIRERAEHERTQPAIDDIADH